MTKSSYTLRTALVLIAAAVLGWFVVAITMDRVFAASFPRLALFWNPGSADANVAAADRLVQDDMARSAPAVEALALRAARRDPTNPGAARLLAVAAGLRHEDAKALALLRYAEQVSRRDLPTELLMIQSSVDRGDVGGALQHYDRALRTQRTSWPVLFPVLARAAGEPAVWQPLSLLLARHPVWWRPFMDELVGHAPSAAALYASVIRTGVARVGSPEVELRRSAELRLIDLKNYAAAFDLYRRSHVLDRSETLLRNGDFARADGIEPFDWLLADTPDLSADRGPRPAGRGNALFLKASNGQGGDLASQILILPVGRYGISAVFGSVGGDVLAFPQLTVTCLGGDAKIFSQSLPPAAQTGRRWQGVFTVLPRCGAQRLAIRMTGSLDDQTASPWIGAVALQRLGAR